MFGICLGHQMLGLALGAKTAKMHQGHHGANHPVKDHTTGKVEIVSMNHGFAVDSNTLPEGVEETHISSSTAAIAACAFRASRSSRCSTTRKLLRVRRTAITSSAASSISCAKRRANRLWPSAHKQSRHRIAKPRIDRQSGAFSWEVLYARPVLGHSLHHADMRRRLTSSSSLVMISCRNSKSDWPKGTRPNLSL